MQQASQPEMAVYHALVKLIGEESFTFQLSDFHIPRLSLVISVIGIYYGNPDTLAIDTSQRLALEGQGIRTIYIDEDAALRNANYYTAEALEYRSHNLLARR